MRYLAHCQFARQRKSAGRRSSGRTRGYTLIELLVVIAIIGLLSTLVLIAFSSARQKARDAVRTGDIAQLRKALEVYYNVHVGYPATVGDGEIGNFPNGIGCLGSIGWEQNTNCTPSIFMGLTPRDPSSPAANPVNDQPCQGNALPCNYSYQRLSSTQYEIHFRLEAATGGLSTGLNCATEAGTGLTCAHQ